MNVPSTTYASGAAAGPAAAAATRSLDYDDFLTLLLAQMKNQDPTKPMDPSQMVSQLAAVSQVGQAVQTNTLLTSLITATSLSQAGALIGKTIRSDDGAVSGQVASVNVGATGVAAALVDGRTVTLGPGVTVAAA